jgi:hypothetical protein
MPVGARLPPGIQRTLAARVCRTRHMQADGSMLAEVDGNRTRRTGIARPNRVEGGGAHQVPGHLRLRP